MSIVWDKIEALARHFEKEFNRTGEPVNGTLGDEYEWHNQIWTSDNYRRAHLEIVDHRESHKLYIVHCTVFPHCNDPSPIWGFDAVCGKNKITGAFHDFSISGDPESFMYLWFKAQVKIGDDCIVVAQAIRATDCSGRQGENTCSIGQSWGRKDMIE